jgi:hypothetical protein
MPLMRVSCHSIERGYCLTRKKKDLEDSESKKEMMNYELRNGFVVLRARSVRRTRHEMNRVQTSPRELIPK